MSLTFVPVALGTATAPAAAPARLRGLAAPAAPPASAGAYLTPSAAVLVCGAIAAGKRSRRAPGTARRFFGGNTAPAPVKPVKIESYKDVDDPWLGSADLGFDPLNLCITSGTFDGANKSPEAIYYNFRESEVKHGRFAMVAFLAIFCEEADRSAVLHQLGQVNFEDKLDGTLGLDEVQAPFLLVGLGVQALAEFDKQSNESDKDFTSVEYEKNRCPGDLGFDPLGFRTAFDLKGVHNIEVNTGRLAMIGITSFLLKEFVIQDAAILGRLEGF